MDIEARLRQLESHHRAALSATVAAKANYLALAGEPSTRPAVEACCRAAATSVAAAAGDFALLQPHANG
jgi:hypothetical protein